jgi:hypothetical protein
MAATNGLSVFSDLIIESVGENLHLVEFGQGDPVDPVARPARVSAASQTIRLKSSRRVRSITASARIVTRAHGR